MRKKLISVILLLSIAILTIASTPDLCSIIPQPNQYKRISGKLKITNKLKISFTDKSLTGTVEIFKSAVTNFSRSKFKFPDKKGTPELQISINKNQTETSENYKLFVLSNKILLSADSHKGIFNGLQSVLQLILFSETENGITDIPCCSISDSPRYSWRGLLLDEARHFFGKEKVKQLIDMMALHKLNIFHWHLSDVQGWRLEIKKYPKLASVGGIGNHSNPNAKATYYTQKEINEIIKYANERFIDVIPEIDMPGHAAAANRAYPEFSGGGSEQFPDLHSILQKKKYTNT
jgi:hexosaminidase